MIRDAEKEFLAALTQLVKKDKIVTQAFLANQMGLTATQLSNIFAGRRLSKEVERRKAARALNYSNYEHFLNLGWSLIHGGIAPNQEPVLSDEELADQGFIKIPFSKSMKLAAGKGSSVIPIDEDERVSTVIIHRPSLPSSTNPANLQAFRVGGDSMEPEIGKNGIVLVDKDFRNTQLKKIKEGSIYVLCWDESGECFIKRLRWAKKNKLLALESRNDAEYPVMYKEPEEIFQIIGKVIWAWREFE